MDRTAQRKAFTDLIQPTFNLQDASDAEAAIAGANRNAIPAEQAAYTRALQAFLAGTGTGTAVDVAKAALLASQAADPTDTAAASTAYLAWSNSQNLLQQACAALVINPGLQEVV